MKIFLDDERPTPFGFTRVNTVEDCIKLLSQKQGEVDELSLDHDLGTEQTGYDVLLFLEDQKFSNPNFILPKFIQIHSANSSARTKMELAVRSIFRDTK
jgi:hypothetical protein